MQELTQLLKAVGLKHEVDSGRLYRARQVHVKNIQKGTGDLEATVLSSQGNREYIVRIRRGKATCTCPDFSKRREVCKHLIAVLTSYPDEVKETLQHKDTTSSIQEAPEDAYIPLDQYTYLHAEFYDTPFGSRRVIESKKSGRVFVEPVVGNGKPKGLLKLVKEEVEGIRAVSLPVNLLIYGPPGVGKTYLGRIVAMLYRTKAFLQRIFPFMEVENLFGYVRAENGSTYFKPTDFTKAVQEGKGVLILDEANTNPALMLSLHEFLNQRVIEIEGEVYRAPDVFVFANGNPGFRNTYEINEATESRFYPLYLEADPGVDYILLLRATKGKLDPGLLRDIVQFFVDVREWSRKNNVPGAYAGFRDTLQFIVPLMGGGTVVDAVHLLAKKLERRTGDPVVVESVYSLARAKFPEVVEVSA